MIRTTAALCGVLASGFAMAQSGGIIVTSGAGGNVTFIEAPALDAGDFQQLHFESSSQAYVVTDLGAMLGAAMRPVGAPEVMPSPDPAAVRVEVEGDGVRLPDERLDTIKR